MRWNKPTGSKIMNPSRFRIIKMKLTIECNRSNEESCKGLCIASSNWRWYSVEGIMRRDGIKMLIIQSI